MALLLTTEQVRNSINMTACLRSCKIAYELLGKKEAINRPRSQVHLGMGKPGLYYLFKSMEGVVPELGVNAVRMTSQMAHWHKVDGGLRKEKQTAAQPGYLVGLILLFDIKTCKLLCIMPDGIIDRMRVGATNGLAADKLSRKDAKILGLLGTGNHARTQIIAFTQIRPLIRIKVYSPNTLHRKQFCTEMEEVTGVKCDAMASPEEAVNDADIVAAATNSREPVLLGRWARPGVHYSSILPYEPDQELVNYADLFLVNTRNARGDIYTLGSREELTFYKNPYEVDYQKLPELAELMSGRTSGRTRDDQITLFMNNMGLGIQFAATANVVYQEAKRQGLGMEISDDFFLQEENAR